MRLIKKDFLLSSLYNTAFTYPSPANLTYFWNFITTATVISSIVISGLLLFMIPGNIDKKQPRVTSEEGDLEKLVSTPFSVKPESLLNESKLNVINNNIELGDQIVELANQVEYEGFSTVGIILYTSCVVYIIACVIFVYGPDIQQFFNVSRNIPANIPHEIINVEPVVINIEPALAENVIEQLPAQLLGDNTNNVFQKCMPNSTKILGYKDPKIYRIRDISDKLPDFCYFKKFNATNTTTESIPIYHQQVSTQCFNENVNTSHKVLEKCCVTLNDLNKFQNIPSKKNIFEEIKISFMQYSQKDVDPINFAEGLKEIQLILEKLIQ